MTKVIGRRVSKLKDKEGSSCICNQYVSSGAFRVWMLKLENLKNYNDGVIISALTFLRKNMSSKMTPAGKKLSKRSHQGFG